MPTVETKIVDEEGNNAEIGELWIAGPSVFLGYFHRDDANAESFVAENNVRWFRTGDTVTKLMGGAIKILGRTSVDIIKSGGYKISAIEIEEALRRLPAVADAAVLGFPDDNWGEKVVAFVLPKSAGTDEALSTASIREALRDELAVYKLPKEVRVVADFPRNAMGKVMKKELRGT